eukprot:16199316-Heterocapsa_arctica.AAC.1
MAESASSSGSKRLAEVPLDKIDPRSPLADEGHGLQASSAAATSSSGAASSSGPAVIPSDVPRSSAMDIEDAIAGPGDIVRQAGNLSTIGSLDI